MSGLSIGSLHYVEFKRSLPMKVLTVFIRTFISLLHITPGLHCCYLRACIVNSMGIVFSLDFEGKIH